MAKKIKYPPSAIKRCNNEVKALLQKIIDTKKGGTTIGGEKGPARILNKNTGDLRNNIKPVIKVRNGELLIDVEVVKYYQYLDKGTDRIKNPWFLTDELTSHIEFLDSIGRLVAAGIAFEIKDNIKTIS